MRILARKTLRHELPPDFCPHATSGSGRGKCASKDLRYKGTGQEEGIDVETEEKFLSRFLLTLASWLTSIASLVIRQKEKEAKEFLL